MIGISDIMLDPDTGDFTGPHGTGNFSKMQTTIMVRLAKSPGALVSFDSVIAAAYENPDLEPEGALYSVRAVLVIIRDKLEKVGSLVRIRSIFEKGYMIVGPVRHFRILRTAVEAEAVDRLLAAMRASDAG